MGVGVFALCGAALVIWGVVQIRRARERRQAYRDVTAIRRRLEAEKPPPSAQEEKQR